MLVQDACVQVRLKELNLFKKHINRKHFKASGFFIFLSKSIPQLSFFIDTTEETPTIIWSKIFVPQFLTESTILLVNSKSASEGYASDSG